MRNARYKLQRVAESKVTKCFAEQQRCVMSLVASGLNVHEQPGKPGGDVLWEYTASSNSSGWLRSEFTSDSF